MGTQLKCADAFCIAMINDDDFGWGEEPQILDGELPKAPGTDNDNVASLIKPGTDALYGPIG